MICEKNKVPKTLKPTTVVKIVGFHELFFPCFLAFVKSKKKKKNQRKSSTLKHAEVDNNKFIKSK